MKDRVAKSGIYRYYSPEAYDLMEDVTAGDDDLERWKRLGQNQPSYFASLSDEISRRYDRGITEKETPSPVTGLVAGVTEP